MVSLGANLYFAAANGEVNPQLWVSDGTSSGTRLVLTTNNQPVFADNIFGAAGRLFFSGWQNSDRELWTSDGTPSGTYRIADINPGVESSSNPDRFAWANRNLFFFANDGVQGVELWVTFQLSLLTKQLNLPIVRK